jgi:hypothetical protein
MGKGVGGAGEQRPLCGITCLQIDKCVKFPSYKRCPVRLKISVGKWILMGDHFGDPGLDCSVIYTFVIYV